MTATAPAATTGTAATDAAIRYVEPAKATNAFNEFVLKLTKLGVSVLGSRVLSVRGRKSGELRSVPVNLLKLDGERYLVAPRGVTQWVRNLRVAGEGQLSVGRRTETFTYTELADHEKPEILRAYLKRWKFEVGVFFDGVDAKASDEKLLEIAPGYPIFKIA
ncbi:nitroreductase/quinone reductase family protein [Amycolatopsis keratiniphila]|uniref:Nitroreductase n=1 Tax=Amycolatopsis keratiniphila subsp. keratiniphila TaxID=227715 RepID=A0A1W2M3X7_9PSEU|nr:nitroreductase/quinone reductase family protein [Amycolatopsis keratiniphila]OLZ60293.1 nitroreductase [Amycolatopsis keratiniphila subsp. nogabecina]ONF74863.1 nitroreductase [Amycolatopsis keratiniphila subsp. keratiniphila]SDU58707.1 deazaflavin-dependent oxidoreductase, nitroreductase family [Amycolatopsis keratiniphila]